MNEEKNRLHAPPSASRNNDELLEELAAECPSRNLSAAVTHDNRSLFLINLSAGLEGCDDQMLPASFRALESELHFTPRMLGHISMAQSLTLALSCPLWGFLADQVSRKLVLGTGCFMWGIATLLLSGADSYDDVLILRAMNGCFMAVIGPVSQSVLADFSHSHSRGLTFGFVQLTANAGRILGSVLITSLGTKYFFGTITGWRFLIAVLGLISILVGGLILVFMPTGLRRHHQSALTAQERHLIERYRAQFNAEGGTGTGNLRETSPQRANTASGADFIRDVVRNTIARSTVVLIILEGFLGCIPWSGLAFCTMYFQYCGLTDLAAGISSGLLLLGGMIAGPAGGYVGDLLTKRWSESHSRPLIAQVSMLLRLPLLYVLFVLLPGMMSPPRSPVHKEMLSGGQLSAETVDSPNAPVFWIMLVSFGLGLSSFAGAAVNRPLLTELALPEHRASAFAIVIAIEGICSAFLGAPLVGHLAERRFKYVHTASLIRDMSTERRHHNAKALAHSMALVTIIPWAVSLFLYTLMHFTLGKDLSDSRKLARARSISRVNLPGLNAAMRSGSLVDFLRGQLDRR